MLLELAQWLAKDVRAFNVLNYITLRAVLATMTALSISFVFGPALIRWLAAKKIGQPVRNEGPQTHLVKAGTPTMGGALILLSLGISTLLWADLSNRFIWVVLIVTLGFGAVGWVDDWRKVVYRNPDGLSARAKFFWQSSIGIVAAIYIAFSISAPNNEKVVELFLQWVGSGFTLELPAKANLIVPFFKEVSYPVGIFGFIVLTYLVIVGASNAVNLTDGLDGLAIMPVMIAAAAFVLIAYLVGNEKFATYLQLAYVRDSGELAVFLAALIGGGLGFLWYNAPPASVFMGDTGSLPLGGALGVVAVAVKHEIVLAIIGGLFVLETVSVIVQVISFKLTGKRVFRMAPIHHHFEQLGWREPTIVIRFWIIAVVLALVGLSTLKLR